MLESDAAAQRTTTRRDLYKKLLALGLGTGATAGEASAVRGSDFFETDQCLAVRLGDEGREVPVMARYEISLWNWAEEAGGELIIPGPPHKNKIAGRTARLQRGSRTPMLRMSRLRTTWAVSHLNRGVPAIDLMAAMGISSVAAMRDLLPYVERLPVEEYRRLLAGGTYN